MAQETLYYSLQPCSLGLILVAVSKVGLCAILIDDSADALKLELRNRFPVAELIENDREAKPTLTQVVALIDNPHAPVKLVLDERGTPFQQQVWKALREIPLGVTVTYSDIAEKIGRPLAVRAVGAACGANPLAIVTPCHRVISKDGKLTGFRWGKHRKLQLLQNEGLTKEMR